MRPCMSATEKSSSSVLHTLTQEAMNVKVKQQDVFVKLAMPKKETTTMTLAILMFGTLKLSHRY